MAIRFAELRSPQIGEAVERGAVAVLPIGQTEQHGPHLPISTDTIEAERICEAAVKKLDARPEAYVLDAFRYGYSQKVVTAWPGTFAIPQETVIEMLRQMLIALADMGFKKIVLVSIHGNHDGVVRVVQRMLADERGIGPGAFFPLKAVGDIVKEGGKAGPGGSCHSGEMETSIMLHLAPELVDMSVATSADKLTFSSPYSSGEAFVSTWTVQKSGSGTYGDPIPASAEFGKRLFEAMVERTAEFIRYYHGLKQI